MTPLTRAAVEAAEAGEPLKGLLMAHLFGAVMKDAMGNWLDEAGQPVRTPFPNADYDSWMWAALIAYHMSARGWYPSISQGPDGFEVRFASRYRHREARAAMAGEAAMRAALLALETEVR
jgi:hypothetical protein